MMTIRPATAEDVEVVLELLTALAEHHGLAEFVLTDIETMLSDGFGDSPEFGVLLADVDGQVAGFVSYTICYQIWRGSLFMQIDDVFVRSSFRSRGLGEALMNGARDKCLSLGLSRLKWEVEPDNDAAIRFYERLGARGYGKFLFAWDVVADEETA